MPFTERLWVNAAAYGALPSVVIAIPLSLPVSRMLGIDRDTCTAGIALGLDLLATAGAVVAERTIPERTAAFPVTLKKRMAWLKPGF